MSMDVVEVECTGDCRLLLTFEGGEQREIEVAALVPMDGVFEPFRNSSYFRQVRVDAEVGTIVWPNGGDICPDVHYERSRAVMTNRARGNA